MGTPRGTYINLLLLKLMFSEMRSFGKAKFQHYDISHRIRVKNTQLLFFSSSFTISWSKSGSNFDLIDGILL